MRLFKNFFNQRKTISFNMKIKNTSWGGGNQFLKNLVNYLNSNNFNVDYKLSKHTDLAFFVNSKGMGQKGSNLTFNYDDLIKLKKIKPSIKCIQRINDTDEHRKSNYVNKNFSTVNKIADYSVFVSDWVLNYHSNLWFDKNKKHKVINNQVDQNIFFPPKNNSNGQITTYRIVTHHFSTNINKGFSSYKILDEYIYEKKLENTELHIVGNVPDDIIWKSANLHGLMKGEKLANFLRSCHIYISGSQYEASAMHWKEGVACGLPLLYSVSGGEIADNGNKYGLAFDGKNDMLNSIEIIKNNYRNYQKKNF